MNLTQLKKSLPYIFKTSIVPIIWGEYGIGKTGGLAEFAKENGYGFGSVNIGTMSDIGDLIGVMRDDPTGHYSRFLPPEIFYRANKFCEENPDKLFVLLIDEANRSSLPGTFQAIMPIAAEHRVHDLVLHDNVKVVLAMNPADTKRYDVLNFNKDKARTSRFSHLFLATTPDEFLAFNKARRKKDNATLRFLSENTNSISLGGYVDVASINEKNQRGWDYIAQLEDTGFEEADSALFTEVAVGLVGAAEVGARAKWKADYKATSINVKDVLEAKSKKALEPILKVVASLADRDDGLSVGAAFVSDLGTELAAITLTPKQETHVQEVLLKMPRELVVSFFRTQLAGNETVRKNVGKIVDQHLLQKYN